ncbi:MAG: ABC transporter permease [Calditrichaeota bacterium]|nr:ABC transporter permease [Calditrichota bacterium]MBT7618467.1 ABC transporter permease [Calditrichota bacterium]MBT7787858.1 ABC transporter permease [Calditrichota bacterium]
MSETKQKNNSYFALVARQFRRNGLAMAGLWTVVVLVVIAIGADFLANDRPLLMKYDGKVYSPVIRGYLTDLGLSRWPADFRNKKFKLLVEMDGRKPESERKIDWVVFPIIPFSPNDYDLDYVITPPTWQHWLGTDDTGRDVLSRMIYGTRISLSIGLVAVSIYMTIGIFFGALAGYFGGWIDIGISRMIELMMCFPVFFLIIAIVAYLPQSIYNIMIVIGLTGWARVARLVRGEFLRIRNIDYVSASQALGFRTPRIIFRHVLPNAMAPVFVSATFGVAVAILTESSLSFLGFGVPPNVASWGSILAKARELLPAGWWITTFPGLAIFLTVTVLNLVGEGLRDAMDPRLVRR